MTGSIVLSWNARLACDRDGGVIADHLRARHGYGFGHNRIDLARHDAAAGLQRERDLGETRLRPLFIQRRSLAIFISVMATVFNAALRSPREPGG